MTDQSKLATLKELIETAEASIHSAKQLLSEMGVNSKTKKINLEKKAQELGSTAPGEENVIEGVFDGQGMIGPDKRLYPVPANYASKSKLVAGDVLKLSIKEDGGFVYKQIGPIERARVIGTLAVNEDGQYQVITSQKTYKVLLASVTYFHAEVGDKVTIIVPAKGEYDWGCIENVLPRGE